MFIYCLTSHPDFFTVLYPTQIFFHGLIYGALYPHTPSLISKIGKSELEIDLIFFYIVGSH